MLTTEKEKARNLFDLSLGNFNLIIENKLTLDKAWKERLKEIDFAFQPIINPFTGTTFAVESLIRNVENCGFETISDFFNRAFDERQLFLVDIELRKIAIKKFCTIDFHKKIKLFYNYDPRILEMDDYRLGETESILNQNSLSCDQICFEINEKYHINKKEVLKKFLEKIRERGIYIAIDDFGSGFAWFELFYHANPDFLKCDRFLINEIENDIKKKSFCLHIISLCRLLGVRIIAEGIETEKEFKTCQELGFDLVQGYYIQKPAIDVATLHYSYFENNEVVQNNKRIIQNDFNFISKEIIKLETFGINDEVKILFEKFQNKLSYNFFPVVDSTGFPLGIIHEKNIKHYVYSPYGKDLLLNKSVIESIKRFVTPCPIVDIRIKEDKILEIFVNNPDTEGVIVTENLKYIGFLTAKSLLNILNEKNLSYARETNPLTKLPGNISINQYMMKVLEEKDFYYYFIYYDFDNFKPFNDKFGFRLGDKAISLFVEILRKCYNRDDFLGHIGGDDFFAGLKKDVSSKTEILSQTKTIINKFSNQVSLMHSNLDYLNNNYVSMDRNGQQKKFDLLSVSAAVIEIKKDKSELTQDNIVSRLAELKKCAKQSKDKIAYLFV